MTKLVVVGGSSGIGRAIATRAAAEGHDVTVLARRTIDDVASISVDVRDEDAVARAFEKFDTLDAVVYAAGVAQLAPLDELTADEWRTTLETNLVGAALAAKHAVPRLAGHNGVMLFCSSTNDVEHWWGLGAYGVSKAALNRLVHGLQSEHPDVRFVRATIGPTLGTEFGAAWDHEILTDAINRWVAGGQFTAHQMPLDDLATVVVSLVTMLLDHPRLGMPEIHLEPPGGPLTPSPAPPVAPG